jgi:hypothetical protein
MSRLHVYIAAQVSHVCLKDESYLSNFLVKKLEFKIQISIPSQFMMDRNKFDE